MAFPAVLAFALAFNGHVWPYEKAFVPLLPGATVVFEAVGGSAGAYTLTHDAGTSVRTAARRWRWSAPGRPGTYTLTFDGPGHAIDVNVFVLVPAAEVRNGMLNGYRIGAYPPPRGRYQPPAGFIEVTKDNHDTRLTPHFRLEQFLCKQEPAGRYPQYVVLREGLLLALEAALARVRASGFDAGTLRVMSGYRTPFYNTAIGDVPYSMHQWGGAADVFVDTRDRGRMDDLNRDGVVDVGDALWLYEQVDRLSVPPGGLGFYPATRAHPPFVHVDVRGSKARWKG